MKARILPLALLAMIGANSQRSQKAFALTDGTKGGFHWDQVRQVDLKTGQTMDIVFDGRIPAELPANSSVATKVSTIYQKIGSMNSGAAALAYDKRNDRLYFAPMFTAGALRYVDLKDKSLTPHQISFDQKLNEADPEATNFTRMVIAPDGYGYAITNDANTMIRFGTGRKAEVTMLGGLIDDQNNKDISVHNRCSSWGGDMIADAWGNLYLFTMRANVFKVSPSTRVATFLGHIEGLPAEFTCNGAAVNADGKVVISGATYTKGYFVVDMDGLKATLLEGSEDVFNASDLATAEYLGQSQVDNSLNKMLTIQPIETGNDKISVYPNPVTDGRIMVSFDKMGNGNYTIELADQTAKAITRKQVTINSEGQVAVINADRKLAKGMYFIRVIDANKRQVFGSRVVVQ